MLTAGRMARRGRALTERARKLDPTEVTVRRDGRAVDDTMTVRIIPLSLRGQERLGEVSASLTNPATILAPIGSDLIKEDRLITPGGTVYRVAFVQPEQEFGVEAAAEVLS